MAHLRKKTFRKPPGASTPLYIAVFTVLKDVFENGRHADKALETIFRQQKHWGFNERAFVSVTSYDIIRYWRLLLTSAGEEEKLTDKILWNILAAWMILRNKRIPEVRQMEHINTDLIAEKLGKYSRVRKIRESVPDWLDELGLKELGNSWEPMLEALNHRPIQVIRTNTLKTTPAALQELLALEGIITHPDRLAAHGLSIEGGTNLFRSQAFKDGLFEMQDSASQRVAELLKVKPGMRVVDACAGAGGKTLHLAALMGNKGRLLALDKEAHKLEELKKRTRRAGAAIIEQKVIDSTKVLKRLHDSADRLLLDVPCSGSGVFRRNPDAKWHLQPADLERVIAVQKDILDRYSSITRVGGLMAYATCSIFPSEGEKQVAQFLETRKDNWKVISENRFHPHINDCDGFYVAVLERLK